MIRVRPRRASSRRAPLHHAGIPILPQILTLGNLVAGALAIIVLAFPDDVTGIDVDRGLAMAAYLIVAGMVFDTFDGAVARMTDSSTRFGALLDSLADLVTFGVAPAVCAVNMMVPDTSIGIVRLTVAMSLAYIACAGLRLARDIEMGEMATSSSRRFRGAPSPAAAGLMVGLILIASQGGLTELSADGIVSPTWRLLAVPASLFLGAAVMVAPLWYPHPQTWLAEHRVSMPMLGLGLLIIVPVIVWPPLGVTALILTYLIAGPILAWADG